MSGKAFGIPFGLHTEDWGLYSPDYLLIKLPVDFEDLDIYTVNTNYDCRNRASILLSQEKYR